MAAALVRRTRHGPAGRRVRLQRRCLPGGAVPRPLPARHRRTLLGDRRPAAGAELLGHAGLGAGSGSTDPPVGHAARHAAGQPAAGGRLCAAARRLPRTDHLRGAAHRHRGRRVLPRGQGVPVTGGGRGAPAQGHRRAQHVRQHGRRAGSARRDAGVRTGAARAVPARRRGLRRPQRPAVAAAPASGPRRRRARAGLLAQRRGPGRPAARRPHHRGHHPAGRRRRPVGERLPPPRLARALDLAGRCPVPGQRPAGHRGAAARDEGCRGRRRPAGLRAWGSRSSPPASSCCRLPSPCGRCGSWPSASSAWRKWA